MKQTFARLESRYTIFKSYCNNWEHYKLRRKKHKKVGLKRFEKKEESVLRAEVESD